jgi:crotonobetainyl-CoA:carnitine CoA-transferase CaiB-like acyl-CoA transferase
LTTPLTPALPPLAGVRILDLSRVLAGPWCTMTLGDLGAEVIKIEQPGRGDDTRRWGPPYVEDEAAYFLCANRNKKSVEVDLATPEGQAIIRELALEADVLVENFKAGGLEKYGLGYAALSELNPRLIYCSISGYGHASPLRDLAGYDYVIQAEGGLMSVTGAVDGAPIKVGVAVVDLFTGMAAVQAILAAYIARQRDGLGQHIDMALFDNQLAMLANVGAAYLAHGNEPARYGAGHPTIVPYQTFEASDGWVVVAAGNDRQFAALCDRVLELEGVATDPRFSTNSARVLNRVALLAVLEPAFHARTSAHWLERLKAVQVPCGQVRSVGQALTAPEAEARDMVRTVEHATVGEMRLVGSPLKLSRTPVVEPTAPPSLGQHTEEVLAGLRSRRSKT